MQQTMQVFEPKMFFIPPPFARPNSICWAFFLLQLLVASLAGYCRQATTGCLGETKLCVMKMISNLSGDSRNGTGILK